MNKSRVLMLLSAVMIALTVSCAGGCSHKVVIASPQSVIEVVGDAGDDCSRACEKLAANSCPSGNNANCATVCRNDQAQGVGSQLDPACVLNATTRAAIVACGVSCP